MFQRPLYQTALVILTLVAFTGAVFLLVAPGTPPGIEISMPPVGTPPLSVAEGQNTAGGDVLLNINAASAADMAAALPGIGPVLSQRIVAYRDANGDFVRTDQLMAVEGIGPATYERIRSLVTVGN